MIKKILLFGLIVASIMLLSSCIPGDGTYALKPAGFFSGIWHGWIAPISLIMGLFDPAIRVYEKINIGWAYDFGFYIAIISGFGGISLIRNRKNKN